MNTNNRNGRGVSTMLRTVTIRRGLAWGVIILCALMAFEIFNYSTTEFALGDVLGNLKFAGLRWATILALAFCGIDFAGIARLFTPEQGRDEPAEVWYLFGAWLLAAGMNAILTWWGVSIAIVDHTSLSGGVVMSSTTLTRVVPVFVAIMVWLIRVLIIGTFSVKGEKLFSQADVRSRTMNQPMNSSYTRPTPVSTPFKPMPKAARTESAYGRSEPTYHNVALSAHAARDTEYVDTPRNS
jgi:hypothetical protein